MASGTETRRRKRTIPVRCTDDEFAVIHAKASRAGLYAGGYLRAAALGSSGPRAVRRSPIDRQELLRLLGELGRVGNNLNQITRALNTGEVPENTEITSALQAFTEMRDLLHKALGKSPGQTDGD